MTSSPGADHYIATLETIDTYLHTLLEDLATDDDLEDDLREDAIDHLRTARSEIDPVLLEFRQRDTDENTNDTATDGGHAPIILQWTTEHGPQRKLTIENTEDGWIRTESTWNGREWVGNGSEPIVLYSIYAPTHDDTKLTPEPLEKRIDAIATFWHTDDPHVLEFDSPDSTVVSPTNPPRYYDDETNTSHPTTIDALTDLVRKYGLPSPRSLE